MDTKEQTQGGGMNRISRISPPRMPSRRAGLGFVAAVVGCLSNSTGGEF